LLASCNACECARLVQQVLTAATSLRLFRDIALQHAPRQAGNTDEIDPEFKKAIQAAVNEAPNATRLIGLVLDCDCEFGGSKRE
jgi:hypothetical protein